MFLCREALCDFVYYVIMTKGSFGGGILTPLCRCVYPIKQLLSGFGVRIDPAIESLIETHIIVTDISRRPRHGTRVRSTGHVLPRDDSRGGQMTYAAAAQAQSQRRGLATAIDSSNEDDSLHTGQASSTKVSEYGRLA